MILLLFVLCSLYDTNFSLHNLTELICEKMPTVECFWLFLVLANILMNVLFLFTALNKIFIYIYMSLWQKVMI